MPLLSGHDLADLVKGNRLRRAMLVLAAIAASSCSETLAATTPAATTDRCDPSVGASFDFSGTIAPRGVGQGIRKLRGLTLLDVRPRGCVVESNRYEVAVKTEFPDACIPNARVRGTGKIVGVATEPFLVRLHRIEADDIAC